MKHLTHILATLVAVVLIGCQESNVIAPIEPERGDVMKSPASDNTIVVNALLGGGDAEAPEYEVQGIVTYKLTQLPMLRETIYVLTLEVKAAVRELTAGGNLYSILDQSEDEVNLTLSRSAVVEKDYFLRGGPLSLSLVMQFEVTATGVSLAGVSIAQ